MNPPFMAVRQPKGAGKKRGHPDRRRGVRRLSGAEGSRGRAGCGVTEELPSNEHSTGSLDDIGSQDSPIPLRMTARFTTKEMGESYETKVQ
ncbi:MAG: hypothetical protein V4710_12970 [Verrucomicrobiota bacterium]